MRIRCPYCGERDSQEFAYLGPATLRERPKLSASAPEEEGSRYAFADWLYLRDNPPGPHHELWYHQGGCGSWLEAVRDVTTHAFRAVTFARQEQQG